MLYELLTLTHPFDGATLKLLVLKILRGMYPPPSQRYSKPLRDLVDSMLKKDAGRRPSINEILALPLLQSRIGRFLSEEVKESEFSHTARSPQKNPAPRIFFSLIARSAGRRTPRLRRACSEFAAREIAPGKACSRG